MKKILFLFLLLYSFTANSVVRFNPILNLWEGNVCSAYGTWAYVPFQPLGSFCQIILPNGTPVQGQIVNM